MRTGRKIQQSIFLENLWKEMEKLSSASSSSNLSKIAIQYVSEGYDKTEITELLIADGFDSEAVNAYVQKIANEDIDTDAAVSVNKKWGFEAEDQITIVNNFDVGCPGIPAISESEAWEKAQEFIDLHCDDPYTIIRVYLI